MYLVEYLFEGLRYVERCRVTDVDKDDDENVFIHLIDNGYAKMISKKSLFDILNRDEVESMPDQVRTASCTELH